MKASVIPIGNSKGIRLPKALLKLCHIEKEVSLSVKGHTILIIPVSQKPRAGWSESFRAMHAKAEDQLFIDDQVDLAGENWEW